MEMKSKILSLELLQTIMQNGQVFRTKEKFINDVLRKYLCPSIGINGTSPNHRVFEISLSLFLSLILHFKDFLKVQCPNGQYCMHRELTLTYTLHRKKLVSILPRFSLRYWRATTAPRYIRAWCFRPCYRYATTRRRSLTFLWTTIVV